MARSYDRTADQLRPVSITRGYTEFAPGSVLIAVGKTRVLCTACFEPSVPPWREPTGSGWLTAEYDMLPSSTPGRRSRNRTKVDGRSQEIQRLIGRTLRAVVDLDTLGLNTVWIDCDVLQADGGTRTAAITGAYVAVCDAVKWAIGRELITHSPIIDSLAAVSVGRVDGHALLDLDYREDVGAEVDMNVAMTGSGQFVEVQASGESAMFSRGELDQMLDLAGQGIEELIRMQQAAMADSPGASGS